MIPGDDNATPVTAMHERHPWLTPGVKGIGCVETAEHTAVATHAPADIRGCIRTPRRDAELSGTSSPASCRPPLVLRGRSRTWRLRWPSRSRFCWSPGASPLSSDQPCTQGQGHSNLGLSNESLPNLDGHSHPSAFPIEMRIDGRFAPNGSAGQIGRRKNTQLKATFLAPSAVCCLRTYRTHVARHKGHSLGGCRKPVWSR